MANRILVIGAGFAGMWSALSAARLLDEQHRTDVEITVVAPDAHHVLAPGDTLVLSGLPEPLALAEEKLLRG